MRIQLRRKAAPFQFSGTDEDGHEVNLDASPTIGGTNQGFRPMHLLLVGLAGCTAIDVVQILTKQRLQVDDIQVSIEGDRDPDAVPSPFTGIQLHYTLAGDLAEDRVRKAIDLSLDKYCSAAAMLGKTARISYTFQIRS